MLLEVTLTQDDNEFGPTGTKVMVNDAYVVGVSRHDGGSKIFVDLSDLQSFKTLYIQESYEQWFILRLNP